MKYRTVLNTLGTLIFSLGISITIPLFYALYYQEQIAIYALSRSAIITILIGLSLHLYFRSTDELEKKDGFIIITSGYMILAIFGTLPFILSGTLDRFVDAYFESLSGLTTTGATVLPCIENIPLSILFWRNQIQWMGGMGIIILVVAILPALGVGGVHLFKTSIPGLEPDKLKPRIKETAKLLYLVYILISLLQVACLYFTGMSLYEAITCMFGTVATAGFYTKNLSIGYYNNSTFEIIIIFFMLVSGINFTLIYKSLHGDIKSLFKNSEFLFYIGVITISIIIIASQLHIYIYKSILTALRYASFQVVSIITTTGFTTTNFDNWPVLSKYILLILMFVGSCAGSTGGAIKGIRVLILLKKVGREFQKILHPRAITSIYIGGKKISDEAVNSVTSFFLLYIMIFIIFSLFMTALGLDMISATSSVAATLGNVGPGMGMVGPSQNYAFISPLGKIILCICMLLGRLEIYAVLTLLLPEFWRK